MRTATAIALVVCACGLLRDAAAAQARIQGGRPIVELTGETFRQQVVDGASASSQWVVLFCQKGNERCDTLQPSLEKIFAHTVDRNADDAQFGKVDCAANEELCKELDISVFPTVTHHVQRRLVGQWTSGGIGLLPWLRRQLASSDSSSRISGSSTPAVQRSGAETTSVEWSNVDATLVWQVLNWHASLTTPAFSVSHLETLHDLILLEDCLFSRTLSLILLAAILGKTAWIIITDAEFLSSRRAKSAERNSWHATDSDSQMRPDSLHF